jgi:hypothetical protein
MLLSFGEMRNLHRILFGFSVLHDCIVAIRHFGVAHEISKIPAETRAEMEDFDWIGVEWIWRGMFILFVAIALDFVALIMWSARRGALQAKRLSMLPAHDNALELSQLTPAIDESVPSNSLALQAHVERRARDLPRLLAPTGSTGSSGDH